MPNLDMQQPKLKLQIGNVDQALVDEVRQVSSPLRADLKLVLYSQPDIVELEFNKLYLRDITYNSQSISGTLAINEIFNARFPAHSVDSDQYAGIF